MGSAGRRTGNSGNARIDSRQRQDALKAANEQIKVPDTAPIEYRNNPSLLDWLNKYCE